MNMSRSKKKLENFKFTKLEKISKIIVHIWFIFSLFYVKEIGTAGVHNEENCPILLTRYKI